MKSDKKTNLNVCVEEVENGYLIRENDPSRAPYFGKTWVATSPEALAALVKSLAEEKQQ